MTIEVTLNGKTQTVTKHQLFALAARGTIGPETIIQVDGKPYTAGKIKGIVFGQSQKTEQSNKTVVTPAKDDVYGLTSLPPLAEPDPFADDPLMNFAVESAQDAPSPKKIDQFSAERTKERFNIVADNNSHMGMIGLLHTNIVKCLAYLAIVFVVLTGLTLISGFIVIICTFQKNLKNYPIGLYKRPAHCV